MAGNAQHFLSRFFFVAVLGTVLIVYGAPFIRLPASFDPALQRIAALIASQPALESASLLLHGALSWRLAERPAPPPPPAPPPAPRPSVAAQPPRPAVTQTVAVAALPPIELEPPDEPAAQPTQQVAAVSQGPPQPDTRPEQTTQPPRQPPAKPKGKWAVVTTPDTKVYSTKGKFLTRIEAGALIAVRDIIDSESGTFARGSVQGTTNRFDDALVPGDAIEVYEGELSQLTARQKELLGLRARLEAELHARKAGTGQYVRKDNPHATAYSKVRKEYIEYLQKVKQLQGARDASSGGNRIDAADELRSLQGKGAALSREYEAASKKYTEWNQSHPTPQGEQRTAIDMIERRLSEIKAALESPKET